jgi:hypothetical protein
VELRGYAEEIGRVAGADFTATAVGMWASTGIPWPMATGWTWAGGT